MLAEALQAEVDAYIARFTADRDERGRWLGVRNGPHQPWEVLTSAGTVEVVAPGVNDRRIDPDTRERRPLHRHGQEPPRHDPPVLGPGLPWLSPGAKWIDGYGSPVFPPFPTSTASGGTVALSDPA